MFGEEVRRTFPGELGASGVVIRSLFIKESMAGIVPMGFVRHVARFQVTFENPSRVGTERLVFLRQMKLERRPDRFRVTGLFRRKAVPGRKGVGFLDVH